MMARTTKSVMVWAFMVGIFYRLMTLVVIYSTVENSLSEMFYRASHLNTYNRSPRRGAPPLQLWRLEYRSSQISLARTRKQYRRAYNGRLCLYIIYIDKMAQLRKTVKKTKQRAKKTKKAKKTTNSHQYYSSITYDGDTLSVKSKKDNEPVKHKKITLKQLRRNIPIAADLIEKYLNGKVPPALYKHQDPENTVSIYPVLPNPVDLGLIPPPMSTPPPRAPSPYHDIGYEFASMPMIRSSSSSSDCSPSTCEQQGQRHKRHSRDVGDVGDDEDATEMIKLFIRDKRD